MKQLLKFGGDSNLIERSSILGKKRRIGNRFRSQQRSRIRSTRKDEFKLFEVVERTGGLGLRVGSARSDAGLVCLSGQSCTR